jgi:hypothetical protein
VIFSVALRFPAADGVNCTLTLQVPCGKSETPKQVSAVLTKSPALSPVTLIAVNATANEPLLVTVTVWAALATFTN